MLRARSFDSGPRYRAGGADHENIIETRGFIMCQMSVVLEKDGVEEMLLEDVTNLQVDNGTVSVSTLFEGPRKLQDVAIRSIDFMAGKVFLQKKNT